MDFTKATRNGIEMPLGHSDGGKVCGDGIDGTIEGDFGVVETEDLKGRLQSLFVKRVAAQLQFLSCHGMEILSEGAGAVWRHAKEHSLCLRNLGGVCEDDLWIPGGRQFIELEVAVIKLLGHTCLGWIKRLPFISPDQSHDPGELKRFGLLINIQEIQKME